jgi:hypothetical protein
MKSVKPAHGDRSSTRRRASAKRAGTSTESSQSGVTTPKRKRSSQPKAGSVSKKIACVSCGQTDVPLMLGGRKFLCVALRRGLTGSRFLPTLRRSRKIGQWGTGQSTGRGRLPGLHPCGTERGCRDEQANRGIDSTDPCFTLATCHKPTFSFRGIYRAGVCHTP